MTDRAIVYTTALPRSVDFLQVENNFLYAISGLLQAAIGSATFVDGLPCTVGAGISVNIGAGTIGQLQTMDVNGVALGSLPLDTTTLMKFGINSGSINFGLVAPTTPGYATNYLIEAQLLEADDTPVVLPYYNAANPTVPFAGPGGAGSTQNTRRHQSVALQLKAGGSATAGTQATPGVDAGWVPLWVVTVPYGASAVIAGNIYQAPGAPFLQGKVAQQKIKAMGNVTLYVSSGGIDTNNGFSINTAFKTIAAAVTFLFNNYDLQGYAANIYIGAGTFAGIAVSGLSTGQTTHINFFGAGSGSTTISNASGAAVSASFGAYIYISGMTLTGQYDISATSNGVILTGADLIMGASTYAHFYANFGTITIGANYSYVPGGLAHFNASQSGLIQINQNAITATPIGTGTYSSAFCAAYSGQWVTTQTITWSSPGSVSGAKYTSTLGGVINTNGGGTNYFPGSTAGSTGSGTATGFYG